MGSFLLEGATLADRCRVIEVSLSSAQTSAMQRRSFLAGLGYSLWLPSLARAQAPLAADPFALGVASGRPAPDSVVLWTRLMAAERAERLGAPLPVGWAIAEDDEMQKVVRSGEATAEARWAHSVHVDVAGLQARSALLVSLHGERQGQPDRPHAHRARGRGEDRRRCASPSPPASSTSRATTPRCVTWRPRSSTPCCSSATTSTRSRGAATWCAITTAAAPPRSTTIATATRSTNPTTTCRPRTPRIPGSSPGTTMR